MHDIERREGSLMGWQVRSSHGDARHYRGLRVYDFLIMNFI